MWMSLLLDLIIDTRIANLNTISERDLEVFQRAEERFGSGRLLDVSSIRLRTQRRTGLDRFLVGNRTDVFSPQSFRVTYVPMNNPIRKTGNKRADHEPGSDSSSIGQLVSKNFGKEFVAVLESGNWKVKGFPIRAEPSCLKCHTSAKSGDVLGYLVYAAKRPPTR
jgi:hypothetical protein